MKNWPILILSLLFMLFSTILEGKGLAYYQLESTCEGDLILHVYDNEIEGYAECVCASEGLMTITLTNDQGESFTITLTKDDCVDGELSIFLSADVFPEWEYTVTASSFLSVDGAFQSPVLDCEGFCSGEFGAFPNFDLIYPELICVGETFTVELVADQNIEFGPYFTWSLNGQEECSTQIVGQGNDNGCNETYDFTIDGLGSHEICVTFEYCDQPYELCERVALTDCIEDACDVEPQITCISADEVEICFVDANGDPISNLSNGTVPGHSLWVNNISLLDGPCITVDAVDGIASFTWSHVYHAHDGSWHCYTDTTAVMNCRTGCEMCDITLGYECISSEEARVYFVDCNGDPVTDLIGEDEISGYQLVINNGILVSSNGVIIPLNDESTIVTGSFTYYLENEIMCNIKVNDLEILSSECEGEGQGRKFRKKFGVSDELASNINIYPTLGNGDIFIEKTTAVDIDKVAVYDLSGGQVHASINMDGERIQLSLANQTDGIYFIIIHANDDEIYTKKVIRN